MPKKAHSHDMISIRKLKIFGKYLCRPLELIFNECISNGIFPSERKKGNLVPIQKKNDNVQKTSVLPCYYQFVAKS